MTYCKGENVSLEWRDLVITTLTGGSNGGKTRCYVSTDMMQCEIHNVIDNAFLPKNVYPESNQAYRPKLQFIRNERDRGTY